jgi:hypothetical protein
MVRRDCGPGGAAIPADEQAPACLVAGRVDAAVDALGVEGMEEALHRCVLRFRTIPRTV